ncbi:2'-5' RNA ligase family protein [Marmoricola sp. RAF53]|uniref:2'-5' RNA ligase family protein n=1 Tax=Marmoricola sp. RAF53 TaxID=3233059 RepID=UPI003F9823BC
MDPVTVPHPATPEFGLPFSALVVPVREAESLVRQRALQVHPDLVAVDRSTVAHVTLLAPFYPPDRIDDAVVHHLARFCAEVVPFAFELTEVCEFPSGATYLAPEPAAAFRHLTSELRREFPEFPPYGGAFDDIVPHLTVPLPDGEDTEALRTALHRTLPLRAHAVEATLVHVEAGNTHVIATLPFGVTAA